MRHPWGTTPWTIDFKPRRRSLPDEVDFAVVGGGFTGLAAAAWMRHLDPSKSVAVLEAGRIGEGASGRTGGMVLAETAAGDKPGLGDVLGGFQEILATLDVDCELSLPGAWEIGRRGGIERSPIEWNDSGTVRVTKEIPGGTLDPGKLVSGLGRAAEQLGAQIFERRRVKRIEWAKRAGERAEIVFERGRRRGRMRAGKILLATNALSLRVSGLERHSEPRLTLAALTAPLGNASIAAAGLGARKPFYTADLPYLWGRLRADNSIVWGAGLVSAGARRGLEKLSVRGKEPARLFSLLHKRIRGLHPALARVKFTHHWGGPILFRENWTPVFDWHSSVAEEERSAIVLGAYAGHGVALSSYLARWAVEALAGRRELPPWGRVSKEATHERPDHR
jgi:glycine/D-amino acid oxidase-like deaminating enzyme